MSSYHGSATVHGDIGALKGLFVDVESDFGREGQEETEFGSCWYIRRHVSTQHMISNLYRYKCPIGSLGRTPVCWLVDR